MTTEALPEVTHAAPGELQAVKKTLKGHGGQTVLPGDCQFGDNDLCYVEAQGSVKKGA